MTKLIADKDYKTGDVIETEGLKEYVKQSRYWKPSTDDEFYYLDHGHTQYGFGVSQKTAEYLIRTHNCFRTREEVEAYKEVLEIEVELLELADWDGEGDSRYLIIDEPLGLTTAGASEGFYFGKAARFRSEKSAVAAIAQVGEERVKKYLLYRW